MSFSIRLKTANWLRSLTLPARKMRARGFTLVELLVVIAIIGIMVGILLPAVNGTRETARRATCTQQMGKLILAVHQYELANETFPSGVTAESGPIRNALGADEVSWVARILPYLDERSLYDTLDLNAGAFAPANAEARQRLLAGLRCPSGVDETPGESNYAGCHHDVEAPIDADNHGVLFLNSKLTYDDLRDGAAYTIVLGEKHSGLPPEPGVDFGWLCGNRATLRNTGAPLKRPQPTEIRTISQVDPQVRVGGFGSWHNAGLVNFAFADGAVRSIAPEIDAETLRRLGHRADGLPVEPLD